MYMVLVYEEAKNEFYFHGTAFKDYLSCVEYYEKNDEVILQGIMRFGNEKYKSAEFEIAELGCLTQTVDMAGRYTNTDRRAIIKK